MRTFIKNNIFNSKYKIDNFGKVTRYGINKDNIGASEFFNALSVNTTVEHSGLSFDFMEIIGCLISDNYMLVDIYATFRLDNPNYSLPSDEYFEFSFDLREALRYLIPSINHVYYTSTYGCLQIADTTSDYATQICGVSITEPNKISFSLHDTSQSNSDVPCKAEYVTLKCKLLIMIKQ